MSRASVYETIEEENHSPVTVGFPDSMKATSFPAIDDGVIIVDPDDDSTVQLDERGIVALNQYYTLKDDVDTTIQESKQLWLDTPLSIYAVQCTSYISFLYTFRSDMICSFRTARPSHRYASAFGTFS